MKLTICEVICLAYLESLEARVCSSLQEAADDASHAGHGLEIVGMIVEVFSISNVTNLTE